MAYSGFFLNLFNMIPLSPFDGGRITAVLSPRIWFSACRCWSGLFVWRPSPMLVLIALMAAPQLWKAWKYRSDSEEAQTYYAVSGATRLEYATYYIVLLAFLAVMTHDVHDMVAGGARGERLLIALSGERLRQCAMVVADHTGDSPVAALVLPDVQGSGRCPRSVLHRTGKVMGAGITWRPSCPRPHPVNRQPACGLNFAADIGLHVWR